MAYQNVGTPRFYVDWGSWLKSIGKFEIYEPDNANFNKFTGGSNSPYNTTEQDIINLVGLNPSDPFTITSQGQAGWGEICLSSGSLGSTDPNSFPNFAAILGHNFHTSGTKFVVASEDGTNNNVGVTQDEHILNSNWGIPDYDGSSIVTFTNPNSLEYLRVVLSSNQSGEFDSSLVYLDDITMGAICYGRYYDMPHSPDMNLKMSIEMDGIKTIQSRGGATLSNATYTKPADWGDRGCWQLGSGESGQGISNLRSGRRVWDLSFSYLSDSSVMPANASTTNLSGSEADDFETNILDGTDFFSQVWNKTMGGHLPFIFQPDNTNNNPDQFAIAIFDMNSLQYEQVANNVYNVKLKIRESW